MDYLCWHICEMFRRPVSCRCPAAQLDNGNFLPTFMATKWRSQRCLLGHPVQWESSIRSTWHFVGNLWSKRAILFCEIFGYCDTFVLSKQCHKPNSYCIVHCYELLIKEDRSRFCVSAVSILQDISNLCNWIPIMLWWWTIMDDNLNLPIFYYVFYPSLDEE